MRKIQLLDCTLRDGGYINDWKFGEKCILDTIELLEKSNIDILEIGFFKDEPYNIDRTVYNDTAQLTKQITPKKSGIMYSAMIEVVNPLPVDKIAPCTEETVDAIRVIIWKRLLKEGFDYCKAIIDKGYKVSIQPARVDQYSNDEFVDMITLFNEIDPWAFYVVDSWGTLNAEQLLGYMDLANKHLNKSTSLGYHGHNNLLQAYGAAEQMIKRNYDREIIIDASVFGIGRGAGNLNTEIIAKHLNENCGKCYDIEQYTEIYQQYIKPIFDVTPWGYSMAYFLTALYGCNPNYASYYDLELHLPAEEIKGVLLSLSEEDKIIYSQEKAKHYLREYQKKTFKLAIIIPTCNRYYENYYYIQSIKDNAELYNTDVIFYDSSIDDDLEKYITNLNHSNIIYDRYNEEFKDDLTIDYKLLSASKKYADKYDYIWFCRDRSIIHIEYIYFALKNDFIQGRDFAIFNPNQRTEVLDYIIYDDACKLAKDRFGEMTSLGSVVYSAKILKNAINEYPIDDIKNHGLWLTMLLFDYIAKYKFVASFYSYNIFEYMSGNITSFWIKNDTLTWIFGDRWDDIINNMSDKYNNVKKAIHSFENWQIPAFGVNLLISGRAHGALKFSNVLKLRKKLMANEGVSYSKVLLVSMMPSWLARYYQAKPNSFCCKYLQFLYRFFVKLPLKVIRSIKRIFNNSLNKLKYKKYDGTNYDEFIDCFAKNNKIQSHLLIGDVAKHREPLITFVIPTYKRPKFLKDAIESILNQHPVDFDWDILVIDNEPYEDNNQKNDTQIYIESIKCDRILYYRNQKNLGVDGNMNRGVELARGKWISFLHDDDLIISEYLLRIKKRIDYYDNLRGKPLGYISSIAFPFQSNAFCIEPQNKKYIMYNDLCICSKIDQVKMKKHTRNSIVFNGYYGIGAPTCGTLVLRRAYMETGGMNEDQSIVTDVITAYKIMDKYSVYLSEDCLGFYRWFSNYTNDTNVRIVGDLFNFREYLFTKGICNKVVGNMFRFEYFNIEVQHFISHSLGSNKKTISDFEHICQYRENKFRSYLFRFIRKIYNIKVTHQSNKNSKKALKKEHK